MIHLLTLLTVKIIQPINPKAFSRAAVKRMVQEVCVNCALLFLGEIDSWIPQALVRSNTSGTSSKESESLLALWLSNKAAMAVEKYRFITFIDYFLMTPPFSGDVHFHVYPTARIPGNYADCVSLVPRCKQTKKTCWHE